MLRKQKPQRNVLSKLIYWKITQQINWIKTMKRIFLSWDAAMHWRCRFLQGVCVPHFFLKKMPENITADAGERKK